jgi:DNA-directed RNA polymerase subunit M/transcription elongation factor TFIIS
MNFYGFEKYKIKDELREEGRSLISTTLEQYVYNAIMSRNNINRTKEYRFAMQQFMIDEDGDARESRIKAGKIGWLHPILENDIMDVDEMRDYMQSPLEVEEGVIECGKCKSKRVFSYQKQTRGCDESSTTFAQCAKCGKQWTYSG